MVSFIEQLEDFGRPDLKEAEAPAEMAELPLEEKVPEIVDHSLRLQPDELEALKKQAFDDGYQAGQEESHARLLSQMTESLETCFSFLEKEEERRRQAFNVLTQKIFQTACDLFGEQVSQKDYIEREFTQDILSFARESLTDCAGDVVLSCAESEKEAFENSLGKQTGIFIKSDPECVPGKVIIISSRNELKLDNIEWQNKVRAQINSAMDHIRGLNLHQEEQENR